MIGFFDSGKGGLTTLAECVKMGFKGEVVYYANHANAPFGNKSIEELNKIAEHCVSTLTSLGCDISVCACNTLSAVCNFDGTRIIPLKIPFELVDNYSDCLFLGTVNSVNALPKWFYSLGGRSLALPKLATMIDNNSNEIDDYLQSDITQHAQTVILGCTHYIYCKSTIKQVTQAKDILTVNEGVHVKLRRYHGNDLIVYLQKEKAEEYTSALYSLAIKPIIKTY